MKQVARNLTDPVDGDSPLFVGARVPFGLDVRLRRAPLAFAWRLRRALAGALLRFGTARRITVRAVPALSLAIQIGNRIAISLSRNEGGDRSS
jgi:hypothetical protein